MVTSDVDEWIDVVKTGEEVGCAVEGEQLLHMMGQSLSNSKGLHFAGP